MVRASAADFARGQVEEAVAQGARALIDPARFARDARGSAYMAPQCLVGVSHAMRVMHEESFAPDRRNHAGGGDDEAVALMNDSALRPHRLGLDARRGRRPRRSASGSRPAPSS